MNKEKIIKQNACLELKNDIVLNEFIKKHFVIKDSSLVKTLYCNNNYICNIEYIKDTIYVNYTYGRNDMVDAVLLELLTNIFDVDWSKYGSFSE